MALDPPLPSVMQARRPLIGGVDLAIASRVTGYGVVLVPVMGEPTDRPALEMTRTVCQRTRAHIVGLHVRTPVATLVAAGKVDASRLPAEVINRLEERIRRRAATAHEMFRDWQQESGIDTATSPVPVAGLTAQWVDVEAPVADAIAHQARTANLIVLGRSARAYTQAGDEALEGALFRSGRPALIVPAEVTTDPSGTIVIAWNDSREAAQAVGAAWSLIARARRIVVFIGSADEDLRRSAASFVTRLDWRGAAAASVVSDTSIDTGSALLATAQREQAGLIVMGAYAYSRLERFVFGGVTKHVLAHGTIPVLMMH